MGTEAEDTESFDGFRLVLVLEGSFEECLELRWRLEPENAGERKLPELAETTLEMVLNHNPPGDALRPPKDAHVKRVPCGSDRQASLSMPEGRRFFIRATAQVAKGPRLCSQWLRTATLRAAERDEGWTSVDPMGRKRQGCKVCPCKGYVPFRWGANSQDRGRCRRCGCDCGSHRLGGEALGGGSSKSLRERAEEWQRRNERESVEPLPSEATWWSDRECDLWFRTGGLFHPARAREELRPATEASQGSKAVKQRRVSVLTPTTESRQSFHESLWACFEAQSWPDKELIVVETYESSPSAFLKEKAAEDSRLVYASYQRPQGKDWSIGLKRNLCAQLASGDILAHFDDDDLYAPDYLLRMVKELQDTKAQCVKLSSWFVFDYNASKWIHCDPLASSAKRGVDETEEWTRQWLYGYGFSYVYLRQAALEHPYQDVNFGEDFAFVTGIQEAKGTSSVALLQDESGVCLHTQHGRNTSASQHLVLKELTREEVLDLEVADLHPVFSEHLQRLTLQDTLSTPDSQARASERRNRHLKVHTPERALDLRCPAGVTAQELLRLLEELLGALPQSAKLFWVPPPGRAPEELRHERLERALRLVAPCLALPSAEPSPAQREAGLRVRQAMAPQDRVGARTPEVWLVLPEGTTGGRSSAYVRVVCQGKPPPGSIWGTFHVELPLQACVWDLRQALAFGLPPGARILAQKPREGLVELQLHEPVPDKVTISEFAAPIRPEMVITRQMALHCQEMLASLLRKREVQEKIAACEEEAAGNEKMFNMMVLTIAMEDVFPRVAEHLDLAKAPFFRIFRSAMDFHGATDNLEQSLNFLELELLFRNKERIMMAYAGLASMREHMGPQEQAHLDYRMAKIREDVQLATG